MSLHVLIKVKSKFLKTYHWKCGNTQKRLHPCKQERVWHSSHQHHVPVVQTCKSMHLIRILQPLWCALDCCLQCCKLYNLWQNSIFRWIPFHNLQHFEIGRNTFLFLSLVKILQDGWKHFKHVLQCKKLQ